MTADGRSSDVCRLTYGDAYSYVGLSRAPVPRYIRSRRHYNNEFCGNDKPVAAASPASASEATEATEK